MTWAELLQLSATLLNDPAQAHYTNAKLLPFLNMTRNELQEVFELNEIPVVHETSAVIEVDEGQGVIAFGASPLPELPDDLVEINRLWWSLRGQNTWYPITKQEYLTSSELANGQEVGYFSVWAWISQEIRLLPANTDLDVKIDYIKYLFQILVEADLTQTVDVINTATAIQYRVAALCAEFIMQNESRANALNGNAASALERSMQISTKGKQSIITRRRPFRAAWKRRGILV